MCSFPIKTVSNFGMDNSEYHFNFEHIVVERHSAKVASFVKKHETLSTLIYCTPSDIHFFYLSVITDLTLAATVVLKIHHFCL